MGLRELLRWLWCSFDWKEKPVPIVDPKLLEDGPKDDDAVKPIESRLQIGNNAKSVHPHTWAKKPLTHKYLSSILEEQVLVEREKYICRVLLHGWRSIEPQFHYLSNLSSFSNNWYIDMSSLYWICQHFVFQTHGKVLYFSNSPISKIKRPRKTISQ